VFLFADDSGTLSTIEVMTDHIPPGLSVLSLMQVFQQHSLEQRVPVLGPSPPGEFFLIAPGFWKNGLRTFLFFNPILERGVPFEVALGAPALSTSPRTGFCLPGSFFFPMKAVPLTPLPFAKMAPKKGALSFYFTSPTVFFFL